MSLFAGYQNRKPHFPAASSVGESSGAPPGPEAPADPKPNASGAAQTQACLAGGTSVGRDSLSSGEKISELFIFFSLQFYLQNVLKLFVQHLIKMRLSN